MGWRGQHNRDEECDREWRALPLRERFFAPRMILFSIIVASTAALWLWVMAERFW